MMIDSIFNTQQVSTTHSIIIHSNLFVELN